MLYEVELNAYALVRQRRQVEAPTLADAHELAQATAGDHDWEYRGVVEGTVEGHVSSSTHTFRIHSSLSLREAE